jgi:hypothetical protein
MTNHNSTIYNLVKFFKDKFKLHYEVEDFSNESLAPFFKATRYENLDIVIVSFPVTSSIECAEIRIRLTNVFALEDKNDISFNNIIFDYNKHFENEVIKINNMSVEEVFENESFVY